MLNKKRSTTFFIRSQGVKEMSNEELARMKSDYQKISEAYRTLKDYGGKRKEADKHLKESRGFTSVELKQSYIKEKETYDKAYNDLLKECQSRYNVGSPIAMRTEMDTLEKKILSLEGREQEKPQVQEEAQTQQAGESQQHGQAMSRTKDIYAQATKEFEEHKSKVKTPGKSYDLTP